MSRYLKSGVEKVGMYWTDVGELNKRLASLEPKLQKTVLRKATREVAKFTLQQAKDLAPEETGQLVASLKVRAGRRSRAKGKQNQVGTDVNTAEGVFKGDEFYAGFLEFGTVPRYTKSGAYRGQIEKGKFDFLRPALYTFVEKKREIFLMACRRWVRSLEGKE